MRVRDPDSLWMAIGSSATIMLLAVPMAWAMRAMPVTHVERVVRVSVYPMPQEPCKSTTPMVIEDLSSSIVQINGAYNYNNLVTYKLNDDDPLIVCNYRSSIRFDDSFSTGSRVYPRNLSEINT